MRNQFLEKKRNRFKIIAIFAGLLLIVGYACKDEIFESSLTSIDAPKAIENAKVWYEANTPTEILLRSSTGKGQMKMKATWDHAFATRYDKLEVVETNVMAQGLLQFLDPQCMEKYNETNDLKYKQSYTRMVFRTNRETGETVGFLMTVVPNLDWLEKSKFKPFLDVTYLFRSKQFGGLILFHNMDGSFSNGWKYEKGKIISEISSLDADPNQIPLRSTVCNSVPIYIVYNDCYDVYYDYGAEDTGYVYDHSFCVTTNQIVGYYQDCYDIPGSTDNGNNNGNNNPPDYPPPGGGGYSGGGGGSGGSTPTPASVAPKATKIFRNSNLILENWKALENMLNKITSDCLGSGLYNGLVSSLTKSQLYIQFVNGSASGFDYGSGKISLDMSWESNRLFHEMWHAYQAYQETYSSYSTSTLNQEFEAWYAQYLYVSKLPEYKQGSTWYGWYNDSDQGMSIRQFEGFIDKKGNLLQGESAFWSYLNTLGQPNSEFRISNPNYPNDPNKNPYNNLLLYPFDDSRTAANDFRNLKNLSKNC